MQCPEVKSFGAPDSNFKSKTGDLNQEDYKEINTLHHNHLISVFIPEIIKVPDTISESLNNEVEYYKVKELNLSELVNFNFISNFVNEGKLNGLSVKTRIDLDDCVSIIPGKKLILSLTKDTYQSLGLQGKISHFSQQNKGRYVVSIDLALKCLTPGRRHYEQLKASLNKLKFDLILSWVPPDQEICPSSLAKYLYDLNYKVELCKPNFLSETIYGVNVPVMNFDSVENETAYELFEWFGMTALQGDTENGAPDSFLNTYQAPEPHSYIGQLKYFSWQGFFTSTTIINLINNLRKFINSSDIPWFAIYVQGFSDSAINWLESEHHFYSNGDNSYLLIINSEKYILSTNKTSNKFYKN